MLAIGLGALIVIVAWAVPNRGYRFGDLGVFRDTPGRLQRLLRRGRGDLLLSEVIAQLWGWTLIIVGAAIMVSVIPQERAPLALGLSILLGAAVYALVIGAMAILWRVGSNRNKPW